MWILKINPCRCCSNGILAHISSPPMISQLYALKLFSWIAFIFIVYSARNVHLSRKLIMAGFDDADPTYIKKSM